MTKITLFEIHPKGTVQLGSGDSARQLLGSGTESSDEDASGEDESGGGMARILVPLVALIVIAAAVRYLGGGSDEEVEDVETEEGGRLDRFTTTTE